MRSYNSLDNVKKKIRNLISKIRYYDYMYYVEHESVISDTDYDLLRCQLESLENEYPHLIENDSPTQNVGFFRKGDHLVIRKHVLPMLSLRNTYVLDEVTKFINVNNLWPVIVEPKIDGVSLSLNYVDSYLSHGLLRGDGKEGEDIIDRIMHIKGIPLVLKENISGEIRGELYIKKEDFLFLNEYRKKKGEKIFQNSRNATAGIVRYKGNDRSLYSYISFVPYGIFSGINYLYSSQSESLERLRNLGFNDQIYGMAEDENSISVAIEAVVSQAEKIFEMDGVVMKTNDLIKMEQLGVTNHHPLGAIAYKFTNKTKETKVEKILWQNSRNGKLTPVALIIPILLDNANIARIALHNKNYIRAKQIGVGSILLIERVGSTVPQVKKVIKTTASMEVVVECPSCRVAVMEDDTNYLCPNINCEARIIERLRYFCKIMKMKGLGERSIKEMVKYVQKPSELISFLFTVPVMNVTGWEKLRFNFLQDIKKIDIITVLVALGVENLSHRGISQIIEHLEIGSFERFLNFINSNDYEATILSANIFAIGKEKINCFIGFLSSNKEEILQIITVIVKKIDLKCSIAL